MKVAGYTRVSSQEQVEGFSLEAQRAAITRYCAFKGWEAPVFYEDAGVSGYTDDISRRPAFARMMADAEAGAFGVVVCHKLDRFARSLLVTMTELKRLSAARVAFVSISEDMDFSSPIGEVALVMLAALAQYFSRNLSTETKKGLDQRRLSGAHIGGIPYGAVRDAAGRLTVRPETADALARLLALAATCSDDQTATTLNREGVPAPQGSHWLPATVRRIVLRGGWLLDQPDPWPARYAAARGRPRLARGRGAKHTQLLTGLMRCACGGVIVYGGVRGELPDGRRDYGVQCRHYTSTRPSRLGCPYRKRSAAYYERLVTDWFLTLPRRSDSTETPVATDDARRDLAQRRRRLGLALADGMIAEADYRARKAALDAEEARLPLLATSRRELAALITTAQDGWGRLSIAGQNGVLRALIEKVLITGHDVTIEPTPELALWLGNPAPSV